ncbi:MAG: T9SS type A sorting domain-containing protein [Flavobacteriales bacterium]|nr:T9SS type A sorting domain-containing protein [Flavobacteriales bacterium]
MTHSTLQKSLTRALAILSIVLGSHAAFSQCAADNDFYLHISTSYNGDQDGVFCVFGGEYLVADVCAGVSYEFSMCSTSWDSQITLYDAVGTYLAYDDDGCGTFGGPSDLFWTATYTGMVYIMVDQYDCTDNTACGTLTMTQYGTCGEVCASNNTLYNVNATPAGVGSSATVQQMWGGDYVNVSVCNGATYTFSVCGATFDTQLALYTPSGTLLAYNDDGCGDFGGASTIEWTSTLTGTVRLLLDEYPCLTNSTNTTLTVTQNTACPVSCNFTSSAAEFVTCFGDQEWVNFYPYYTGDCTVSYLYLYSDALGWETIDLTADGFTSGSEIGILLGVDNTTYTYYWELSNGTTSADYLYSTTQCPAPTCAFTDVDYLSLGCADGAEDIMLTPYFTGACYIAGMWVYTAVSDWQYVDLSVNAYMSGESFILPFNFDNTFYQFYFVLDNDATSATYSLTTGTCDIVTCNVTDVLYQYNGCVDTNENLDFYVYFTGACSVTSLWTYTTAGGWQETTFPAGTYFSGDPIGINLTFDNTTYDYYFELSDGTTSDLYTYTTGNCDNQTLCSNLQIFYTDNGCVANTPNGTITPFYAGGCTVEGIYTSVNGGAYEYLDLSAYGFVSGDDIGLFFNVQDADYEVFYVLSDGSTSPSTFFLNPSCVSGEMICDCAGTQIPIEAMAWLGDGTLDDGSFNWDNNPDYPVNFNCAAYGFDCGDELPAGYFYYDPYGVCSGAVPPANGCVDEFCYNIDVDVATDCHPEDIAVYVFNSNGDQVFTASSADFIVLSDNLYTFSMCLPADCYTYMITDAFSDGLAGSDCASIGYTGIYDYSLPGYVVFANGDEYTSVFSGEFCTGPQTVCDNLSLNIFEEPCYPNGAGDLMPSISYVFDFSGPCTVESIFYSVNGADFVELNVAANNWGSGDQGLLYYLQPNSNYTIYYTTDDGAASFLYDFTTGDCNNEITICDCDGTQHSIGVTSWLGDGLADNGFYQWAGQYVNFNCSTWGYDCGDIEGAPNFDPYNVCDGQLPPFNGCIDVSEVLGCTDPTAINYNPQATINDGSCIYNLQVGCTNPAACNYNDLAIIDDGSCEFISCTGCTDPDASNYDPTATVDDGSCIYLEIDGCTDPDALNYDPLATNDDGSCIYSCVWPNVSYDSHCTQGNLDGFYIDVDLTSLGNGAPYTITNSYNNQQQVMSLTGSVTMGPFPNGEPVVILVTSNTIDCFLTSQPLTEDCSVPGIYGCTDPEALNYNPDATIDDGSCIYDGVEEVEVSFFTLYPNPAKDKIMLTNNGVTPVAGLRILDGTGRLVLSEQIIVSEGNSHTLDVSTLAQGNYVIEILTDTNIEHHTVIIQK